MIKVRPHEAITTMFFSWAALPTCVYPDSGGEGMVFLRFTSKMHDHRIMRDMLEIPLSVLFGVQDEKPE